MVLKFSEPSRSKMAARQDSPTPLPARALPPRAVSSKIDDKALFTDSEDSDSAESEDSQVEVVESVQPKSVKGKAKADPSPIPPTPMITRNRGRPSHRIVEVEVPILRKPPGLPNDPLPPSPVPKSSKQRRAERKKANTPKGAKSTKEKFEAPVTATVSANPFSLPEFDVNTLIRVANEVGDHAIVSYFILSFSFLDC